MDDKQRAAALGLTVDQFQQLVGDDPMEDFNNTFAKKDKKDKKPTPVTESGKVTEEDDKKKKPKELPFNKSPK